MLMRIIISPAKKMRVDPDNFEHYNLPQFLTHTEQILQRLRQMSFKELKTLWKCNDQIANQNFKRLQDMDLYRHLTPALISYDGIQYQYMAPNVFTYEHLDYVQKHLRILSGFYGILRPFDGVTPYRLEMQARLDVNGKKNLYDFWGENLAQSLLDESDCIVNLASKEYSICISQYFPKGVKFITCVFGEEKDGRVIEKGTLCKMARGEMVRYMAENEIRDVEGLKEFNRMGYRFSFRNSDLNTYVFIKEGL